MDELAKASGTFNGGPYYVVAEGFGSKYCRGGSGRNSDVRASIYCLENTLEIFASGAQARWCLAGFTRQDPASDRDGDLDMVPGKLP